MGRRRKARGAFRLGMAVGIGVGAVVWLIPELIGRARRSHIVRLQKSIQIGAPVKEVFDSWLTCRIYHECPMMCARCNTEDP